MRLSKTIPRHIKTEHFGWIHKDFMPFNKYNDARRKAGMSVQSSCFWCKKPFVDGEMMALASRPKAVNVLLCHQCADKMEG